MNSHWNAGVKYSPLSFFFLNIPGISRLQWHPFSTTSTTLDDANEVTLCIKRLGDWTETLHDNIAAESAKTSSACPFAIKTEGPYGHESNYFLRSISHPAISHNLHEAFPRCGVLINLTFDLVF